MSDSIFKMRPSDRMFQEPLATSYKNHWAELTRISNHRGLVTKYRHIRVCLLWGKELNLCRFFLYNGISNAICNANREEVANSGLLLPCKANPNVPAFVQIAAKQGLPCREKIA